MNSPQVYFLPSKLNKNTILTCLAWSFASIGLMVLVGLFITVGIRIMQKHDPNDFCQDFYAHTCSKIFSNDFNLTEDRNELVNDIIRNNINKLESSDNEISKMITACMNTEEIYSRGVKPLRDLVSSLGGFPTKFGGMKRAMSILGLVTRRLANNGLFYVSVLPNFYNSTSENVIFLSATTELVASPTPQPFARIRQLEFKNVFEIQRIVNNLINQLNDEETNEKDATNLAFFWFRVNKIKIGSVRNELELTTIKSLIEITQLDLLTFFEAAFGPEAEIQLNTKVIVHDKKKIADISQLMSVVCDATRTLTNFAVFNGIRPLLRHTTLEMQKLSWELEKMITFQWNLSPWLLTRVEMCYKTTLDQLPYHATRELYGETYVNDDFVTLYNIFETIKRVFDTQIADNDWLSERSKMKIRKKLDLMKLDLLYPETVANSSLLTQLYDSLLINNKNHFENVLSTTAIQRHFVLSRLYEKRKNKDKIWILPPVTISAWNLLYENKIQLPIGLLLQKSFNSKSNLIEQYSDIGFVIAHEIAHGFDSTGMKFNENGLMDDSLLDNSSRRIFKDKLEFLTRQYNQFCPTSEICIDGEKTLDENIADVIGVKMSYLGLISALKSQEKERNKMKMEKNFIPFPTPFVQFFYYYAKKQCIKPNLDLIKWIIKYSQHSPNQQRVNGPLSNLDEFSRLFQCRWIDSMNPVTKFNLW